MRDVLVTLRDNVLSSGCILDVQLLHPFDHEEVRRYPNAKHGTETGNMHIVIVIVNTDVV